MPSAAQSPSTVVDDSSIGSVEWSNPSNATSSDNSYATASLGVEGAFSHYLKATNFGFSVPPQAEIVGVLFEVERYASTNITDSSIKLVKGNTISGDDKSEGVSWQTSDDGTYVSYGGQNDLWGLTLTPNHVNSSGFGAVIACQQPGSFNDANVDHMRLTVYYSSKIEGVQSITGVSTIQL